MKELKKRYEGLQCQRKGCRNKGNVWVIESPWKNRTNDMVKDPIGFCNVNHCYEWIYEEYLHGDVYKQGHSVIPKRM